MGYLAMSRQENDSWYPKSGVHMLTFQNLVLRLFEFDYKIALMSS